MDPKQQSQLDPQLQEAYNRVMGTPLNTPADPAASTPSPQPTTPADASNPIIPPDPGPTPAPSDPSLPPTPPTMPTINPTPTEPAVPVTPVQTPEPPEETPHDEKMTTVENTASVSSNAFVAKKTGGMKISPVIIVVGGIAFLLLYTILWIKIFNLPVPYINQ